MINQAIIDTVESTGAGMVRVSVIVIDTAKGKTRQDFVLSANAATILQLEQQVRERVAAQQVIDQAKTDLVVGRVLDLTVPEIAIDPPTAAQLWIEQSRRLSAALALTPLVTESDVLAADLAALQATVVKTYQPGFLDLL